MVTKYLKIGKSTTCSSSQQCQYFLEQTYSNYTSALKSATFIKIEMNDSTLYEIRQIMLWEKIICRKVENVLIVVSYNKTMTCL